MRKSLIEKCSLKRGSNRAKMLATLERQRKSLPVRDIARRLYGDADRTASVHMVAIGLADRLKKEGAGYQLVKVRTPKGMAYGLARH